MFRSSGLLFSASLAGQVLLLAGTLWMARISQPADFALFALFVSLGTWGNYLSGGRFDAAIPVASETADALGLLKLCTRLNVAVAAVIALVVAGAWVAWQPGFESAAALAMYPALVLSGGLILAWEGWANRVERYDVFAGGRFVRAAVTSVGQIALAGAGVPPAVALCGGHLLGSLLALALLTWRLRADVAHASAIQARSAPGTETSLLAVARRFGDYPRYNMLHGAIDAAAPPLVILILKGIAGDAAAGAWALVNRLIGSPLSILGGAIRPVFLRRLAALPSSQERSAFFRRVALVLSSASLVPLLVTMALGPTMFVLILGEEWAIAGDVARYAAPFLFLSFVMGPLGAAAQVAHRLRAAMYFGFAHSAVFLGALAAGLAVGQTTALGFAAVSMAFVVFFPVFVGWLYRAIAPRAAA